MASSSLTPEDIRAAAETHRELGPDYQDAVIQSFLDKVGPEIDARVDARMAQMRQFPFGRRPRSEQAQATRMAVWSIGLGIPLSGIVTALNAGAQLKALCVIWAAIAVINVAYGLRFRPSREHSSREHSSREHWAQEHWARGSSARDYSARGGSFRDR